MIENREIEPCRKCNKVPKQEYPPSRIEKKDWICRKCASKARNKWLLKYRHKKRLLQDLDGVRHTVSALAVQLEYVHMMEDAPRCPFCDIKMRPNRRGKEDDKGEMLSWSCSRCNEAILAEKI